eukprot:15470949-Heterocapsa_arctica.AAC.1
MRIGFELDLFGQHLAAFEASVLVGPGALVPTTLLTRASPGAVEQWVSVPVAHDGLPSCL